MRMSSVMAAAGAIVFTACSGPDSDPTTNGAKSASTGNPELTLPLYDEAVNYARPVLPAMLKDGDCPSVDQCEFGTEWRVCESLPLYRDPADGAPVVRTLKAMEAFVAESGRIELVAPGRIELLDDSYPYETGGAWLTKGTAIEVYGPLHDSRAFYFNPKTGKAWSSPANEDEWWWDEKRARMTAAPKMNWWVKAKAKDGTQGWLKLANVSTAGEPINFYHKEIVEAWDIHKTRDDETPDCKEMLAPDDPGVGEG